MSRQRIYLIAGPLASAVTYLLLSAKGFDHPMAGTAAITVWMAFWWVTEAVDLGVTSLIPFVAFPMSGILDSATVAGQYMEQTIFLFMGGFFMAYAMEKWGLHERLAYTIIRKTGGTPVRVLAGVMMTTFFISMWISNTATTLLMLTAVLAIVRHEHLFDAQHRTAMATGYLLALTYSASIGGLSTIVGTPTNMILVGFTDKIFPENNPVTFNSWFRFSFPFALLLGVVLFLVIRRRYFRKSGHLPFDLSFVEEKLRALGKSGYEERSVLFVFGLTVTAWFTRSTIDFGNFRFPGWSSLLPNGEMIKDSTVAIFTSLLLFLWPARNKNREKILVWQDVQKLPLRILLLFGSGFAIAEAFQRSGLGQKLAQELVVLAGMPVWAYTLGIGLLITVISEFASNVACIQLMLPVLSALAVSLNIDPLLLMIPATLAASFGFMMPVATAPNTIVYGTGQVPVQEMMRTGLHMNILAVMLLTLYTWLFY
jgi:sodium-dependent dicarboxylate transporter 2/3/5